MENYDRHYFLFLSAKEILSLKEASIYMDVSTSYLYKLTSSKCIIHFKPTGKRIYFKRSDLDNWMTSNKCESVHESLEQIESFISKSGTDD